MSDITLLIPGKPRSKGSYRAIVRGRHAFLASSDEHLAEWTNLIKLAWQHQKLEPGEHVPGPSEKCFELDVNCEFSRPKSHFGTGRNAGVLKPNAPLRRHCRRKPDGDKIARAIMDALENCCWKDDCQVVMCKVRKWWSDKYLTTILISDLIQIE